MPYSKRETKRRYDKFGFVCRYMVSGKLREYIRHYTAKGMMGRSPGREVKRQWARDVRNAFKQEMQRRRDDYDCVSIPPESRLKNYWDWY